MYHEAVDRRRGAERRYAVLLYLAHYLLGRELLVLEDEHRRAGEPLAVELAPRSLGPARVGHGKVDAVLAQVVPEVAGGDVAEGIDEVVSHHLRLAAGAAGEVHQHGVVVVVDVLGALERRYVVPLLVPIMKTVVNLRAYADERLQRGALVERAFHLRHHVIVAYADDGLHVGHVVTVNYVVCGEHVRCRHGHGANLAQGEH